MNCVFAWPDIQVLVKGLKPPDKRFLQGVEDAVLFLAWDDDGSIILSIHRLAKEIPIP